MKAIPFVWTFVRPLLAALVAMALGALPAHGEPVQAPAGTSSETGGNFNAWLAPLQHTAWTARQGAPSDIMSITQTADGWLWLATPGGLFRFDGVKFERCDEIDGNKLLTGNINTLLAVGNELWVGYRMGGISHFFNGHVEHFGEGDGLPASTVMAIRRAPDGKIWAATTAALELLVEKRWQHVGAEAGLPEGSVLSFFIDRQGRLLIQHNGSDIYARGPAESRFRKMLSLKDVQDVMSLGNDGAVWLNSATLGVRKLFPATGTTVVVRTSQKPGNGGIYIDRRGMLWRDRPGYFEQLGATEPLQPRQSFGISQGLSGETSECMFEDREGNLWLGTTGGLDRFRPNRLTQVPLSPALHGPAIVRGDGSDIWAAGQGNPAFFELSRGKPGARQMVANVSATTRDVHGAIWVGNDSAVTRLKGTSRQSWPLPPEAQGWEVQALALADNDELWVSIVRRGTYTLKDGKWRRQGQDAGLPDSPALVIFNDGAGTIWLGYPHSLLIAVDGRQVRRYGSHDGLDIGNILGLHKRSGRLWAGGADGLAFFEHGRFHRVSGIDDTTFRGVSGLLETASGELWLNGADGITRVARDDLARVSPENTAVRYERFDYQDGLSGIAPQLRPIPTLLEAGDGKLWYSTSNGIGWIDPAHIRRNPHAPTVLVQSITADDKVYLPRAPLALPEGTRSLKIDFTATSLTMPERVRFRYKLEGVDQQWQQSSDRRAAFYTNLSPGDYRFRVAAANEDGKWSSADAVASFRIAPGFTQTPLFLALVAFAALVAVYGLYRWRLAQMTARVGERLHERLMERERIARALHDTLLQGMQGLILRFQSVCNAMPREIRARALMEDALESADQLIVDGRNQVMNIRAHIRPDFQLADALRHAGMNMVEAKPVEFSVDIIGQDRAIQTLVEDEVYCIAREALSNAFAHSRGSSVVLSIEFGRDLLAVSVRDDGCGMDEAVLAAGHRPGHWGLVGMAERAENIGGRFEIRSAAGAGTLVTLTVPAMLVYRDAAEHPRWHRLKRLARRRRDEQHNDRKASIACTAQMEP
jgi:signal transduction histidine kinase